MPRPRTIHDFYGFPRELFGVQYPAPGLLALAEEVSDVVHPTWVGADVVVHTFPEASIPVVARERRARRLVPAGVARPGGVRPEPWHWGYDDD